MFTNSLQFNSLLKCSNDCCCNCLPVSNSSLLCLGLQKAWGASTLLMLISVHFEMDLIICCNFCLCLGFIYLLMEIGGSFTLGRLVDFISAHFCLNGALYFPLKNSFCQKDFFFTLIFVHLLLT